jgi:hypothetical protein
MKLHVTASLLALVIASGCSAAGGGSSDDPGTGNKGTGSSTGVGGMPNLTLANGGMVNLGAMPGTGAMGPVGQPMNCAEAAEGHTYVGCDFWPTIVANPVWTEFEPAVVVANGNDAAAAVTVEGPNGFHQEVMVAPKGLETIMLKWVMDLKGPEFSPTNTSGGRLKASSRADKGAYHMTSSLPITAWQFNPLKYVLPAGGCSRINADGCRSATNDASLLIPSTAMTETYRVFGYSSKNEGDSWGTVPGGVAITATKDGTTVQVQLGPKCGVEIFPTTMLGTCVSADAAGAVKEGMPGDVQTYTMNAGDVVQLVSAWSASPQVKNADLSGTVVKANAGFPVQVVAFNAISQLPDYSVANADHMEETVLPAEVIGNKYIVVPPATPNGNSVGHVVRIYGNKNGTTLTYPEGKPPGAPDMINEGDVFQIPPLPTGTPAPDCTTVPDHCMLSTPFVVEGSEAFAVASFMVGGTLQMPGTDATTSQGDPSFSMEVTPQQFRQEYTFLAPADYLENFADILVPSGASVVLDGAPVTDAPTAIGASGWGSLRVKLNGDNGGSHTLTTDNPLGLGLQVMGFGFATSYYYPGGLNLQRITEPPVIVVK